MIYCVSDIVVFLVAVLVYNCRGFGWDGIELIFFLVAGVVLCFGFGMKIMLITY